MKTDSPFSPHLTRADFFYRKEKFSPSSENTPRPYFWRELLYKRFRGQPQPLTIFEHTIVPAATLWTASRLWVDFLRAHFPTLRGVRIILAVKPSPLFLNVLLAALWEECTLVILPPEHDFMRLSAWQKEYDASLVIAECSYELPAEEHVKFPSWLVSVDSAGCPHAREIVYDKISTSLPATPEVRLILRTSGTSSHGTSPRSVALSDENIASVLESHFSELGITEHTRLLSVLPWHHCFGLIIDVLPALFGGADIVRDMQHGRNIQHILALAQEHDITCMSAVPLVCMRLAEHEEGKIFLQSLSGGVVGGAPISHRLANILRTTQLRVGYGLTEASPGIALGERGEFFANYIGRVLGCEIHIDNVSNEAFFKGRNACVGYWDTSNESPATHGFMRLSENRFHATGDIVEIDTDEKMFIKGRVDDVIKLPNGRAIYAAEHEGSILQNMQSYSAQELRTAYISPDEHGFLVVALGIAGELPKDERELHHLKNAVQQATELAPYISQMLVMEYHEWKFTPKGDTHRMHMREMVQEFLKNNR